MTNLVSPLTAIVFAFEPPLAVFCALDLVALFWGVFDSCCAAPVLGGASLAVFGATFGCFWPIPAEAGAAKNTFSVCSLCTTPELFAIAPAPAFLPLLADFVTTALVVVVPPARGGL